MGVNNVKETLTFYFNDRKTKAGMVRGGKLEYGGINIADAGCRRAGGMFEPC